MAELISGDEEMEVEKLARLISDELDSALIDVGLIPVHECLPFDQLAPTPQAAIRKAAAGVYRQMVYDTRQGFIRVIRHSERG